MTRQDNSSGPVFGRRHRPVSVYATLVIAMLILALLALLLHAIHPELFVVAYVGLAFLVVAQGVRSYAVEARISRLLRRADMLDHAVSHGGSESAEVDQLEDHLDRLEAVFGATEHRLAQRHPVTGLPTREPLLARIEQDIAVNAPGGLLGTIAFVDFERLSAFDPELADRVFAALIARAKRMLGAQRMLAQIDRSRLAVWYGPQDQGARDQLRALGYALGDAIRDGDREVLPEIRIGAAACPEAGEPPERLLTRAIAALSRSDTAEAEPDGDPVEMARARYALEQDLRRAVGRAELELQYQPLVDAVAGRVCGAEALLRWQHPVQGLISPARFVPIMEAAGLADEIGLWTLNAACREARGWQRQALNGLHVAVNVSGHQLTRSDMRALVERTLARHSLQPEDLEIELTETVATGDVDRTAALFRELRALGMAIAIDDFGTGYSSFSALRALTFDKIKIDREFVTSVESRPDSQAICRSILALGAGLGIRVLAEGVERREEYAWLRAAGCVHFQGYYFAPPLDPDAFIAFVRDTSNFSALLALPAGDDTIRERLRA